MEALQQEADGLIMPGDEIVAAGAAGLYGTRILVEKQYDRLLPFFSARFLDEAAAVPGKYAISPEGMEKESPVYQMARDAGARGLFIMGKGGFLTCLWKFCEASQVGLIADLRKVPIRQETIEICEVLDVNPYNLFSGGAFLAALPSGEGFVNNLKREGIMAEVIGSANNQNPRKLYSGEGFRYLDRPAPDEIDAFCKRGEDTPCTLSRQ